MPSLSDWQTLLPKIQAVVLDAGELIRAHSQKPKDIRHKGRIDLVTATDIAVENHLKQHLKPLLPEATFLAEESAADARLSEYTWIIDPVDGTTNFAHGLPHVATSLGLWHKDDIVLGIVNAPLLEECFTALQGGGAFCNGKPLRVSSTDRLEDSLIATGFPYAIEEELPGVLGRLEAVLPATQGLRRCGAAALDLACVAAGRYEAYYELRLNPWDVSAGWLLVREAGGTVTRMNGTAYHLRSHDLVASNGRIHEAMLGLLKSFAVQP